MPVRKKTTPVGQLYSSHLPHDVTISQAKEPEGVQIELGRFGLATSVAQVVIRQPPLLEAPVRDELKMVETQDVEGVKQMVADSVDPKDDGLVATVQLHAAAPPT